jgi:hypothetical protein
MAEAALEEDDDDDELDDRIPAPPSKSLVRQIQRAIRLSESSDQVSPKYCFAFIPRAYFTIRLHCSGCNDLRESRIS